MNATNVSTVQSEESAPDWLTVEEAAAVVRVSLRTMRRLTSPDAGRDRIPAARFGGSVRIRRAVLDKYLERRTA